jgi:hypothetical protein
MAGHRQVPGKQKEGVFVILDEQNIERARLQELPTISKFSLRENRVFSSRLKGGGSSLDHAPERDDVAAEIREEIPF